MTTRHQQIGDYVRILRGEVRASIHPPSFKAFRSCLFACFSHFLLAFLPSSVTIILTARKSPGGLGDTRYKDIGNGNLLGVLFFSLTFLFLLGICIDKREAIMLGC